MLGRPGTRRHHAVVQGCSRIGGGAFRFTAGQGEGLAIDIKNLWIVVTIGIVWLIVFMTVGDSEPLVYGDDNTEIRVALLANWFWGLVTTVFVLRSTVFRRPNEAGYGETNSWPWLTLVVAVVWIVAGTVATNTGTLGIASDSIQIPVGAIVALPVAAAVTSYAVEFLVQGFAARNAGNGGNGA